jgi:hypothetical protein
MKTVFRTAQTIDGQCSCRECESQRSDAATPPDGYSLALRAAAAPSEPRDFEAEWKAARTLELEAMRAALDKEPTPRFKTLSAEELSPYTPPNPYEFKTRSAR